jgi:uncharacterized ferredoxin-like protein
MSKYIEYKLEDGTILLIEGEDMEGIDRVSNDSATEKITRSFEEALDSIKKSALVLRRKLEEVKADEVEVTFGIKATGEAGNFVVGKVGLDANYTVKLKWENKS